MVTAPAGAHLRDGIAAARAKRVDVARTLLQQAVDATPDNALAWFWLAVVAPSAEAAISHLRRAMAIDPSHVAARESLAKLLLAQAERMRDASRRLFRDAAIVAPTDTRIWRAIVQLAPSPDDAVADVRDLVALTPEVAEGRTVVRDALTANAHAFERAAAQLIDPVATPGTDASAPAVTPVEEAYPNAPSTVAMRTVMVVDDSPTICKILSLTLEGAGYAVIAETSGESALRRLSDVMPDVVLLDIAMPGIDGYETCKRIKQDSRTAHLPVLMLSGKDALFDKVKGHMAGATEYLTKPFEATTVLAAVAEACSEAA